MSSLRNAFLLLLIPLLALGQSESWKCDWFILDIVDMEHYESVQNQIEQAANHQLNLRSEIIIPLVFHVVWKTEEENISKEQIISQIDELNRAFLGQNQDRQAIPEIFKPFLGIPGFSFCLATEDPEGNQHDGIIRVNTEIDYIGDASNLEGTPLIKYSDLGGSDAWDASRYINIWIGRRKFGLGESTFPGTVILEEEGIVMDPYYVGNVGAIASGEFSKGRVLIHEMGHYFNLLHLDGDNGDCFMDDNIEDTPQQNVVYSGCPDHPQISCNSADMFMNFMALTNDHCSRFFTQGQSEMMRNTLTTVRSGLMDFRCNDKPSQTIGEKVTVQYLFNSDQIYLDLNLAFEDNLELNIYSLIGERILYRKVRLISAESLNISILPTGIYILELKIGEAYHVEKFFKP